VPVECELNSGPKFVYVSGSPEEKNVNTVAIFGLKKLQATSLRLIIQLRYSYLAKIDVGQKPVFSLVSYSSSFVHIILHH